MYRREHTQLATKGLVTSVMRSNLTAPQTSSPSSVIRDIKALTPNRLAILMQLYFRLDPNRGIAYVSQRRAQDQALLVRTDSNDIVALSAIRLVGCDRYVLETRSLETGEPGPSRIMDAPFIEHRPEWWDELVPTHLPMRISA